MERRFYKLEEHILAVLMPSMVIIVFLGTLGRYSGLFSIAWYEEAARYIMIWLVFIGLGAGAKKNAHFAVELLFMITPSFLHKFIRFLIVGIVLFFNGTVIVLSFRLLRGIYAMQQTSPSLGIPIWMAYSAIPVGCLLMGWRTIQYYLATLAQRAEGGIS